MPPVPSCPAVRLPLPASPSCISFLHLLPASPSCISFLHLLPASCPNPTPLIVEAHHVTVNPLTHMPLDRPGRSLRQWRRARRSQITFSSCCSSWLSRSLLPLPPAPISLSLSPTLSPSLPLSLSPSLLSLSLSLSRSLFSTHGPKFCNLNPKPKP